MKQLESEAILRLQVRCGDALEVGASPAGLLRVIPIIGGTFEGRLQGEVMPGGADWNTQQADGSAHVFAKYLLKTQNGAYISVENEGFIPAGKPSAAIQTTPRFTAAQNGPYGWLNHGAYVGSLGPGQQPGTVAITVYRLK